MKLAAEAKALSARIGHDFSRPELLTRALTHGSISSATHKDNERLEFLGDRVLGLTIAEALLKADREATEGQIAPRYNRLVRREACAEVARQIALGDALKLGRSEQISGGRRKEALLADAMEAVIGAVYLDAGFETAKAMVLRLWGDRVTEVEEDARDAKTALQEWAQARGQTPPSYGEVSRSGPPHDPVFVIEVRLDSGERAEASAKSKRAGEQAAAQALLDRLDD